jgi:membrane protease YdiL (CAAX protease family)
MTRQTGPAISGLLVAWGGTALLVSPVVRSATNASSTLTGIVGQIAMWLLCAAVVGIVVYWEKRPLTSLWLKPLQWQSFAWAGVLVLVSILILFPITEWVRNAVGLPGYAMGMETALAYPGWLRVFAVFTAGVVEETLFRGFAVTRLLQLGAGMPLAVGVSSAVFAALHLPVWGAGPSLGFFIGGLATTAFFVWRRDLVAMIIAHVAIDMWGLVVTPALSRWWD